MKIKIYQVDAFSSHVFRGNPAAVCPLDKWLDEKTLQNIAQENNLSETAFFVISGNDIHLRWFTPAKEVDLCGHATLAAAHVLYKHLSFNKSRITFITKSGPLIVTKTDHGYSMDFPASTPKTIQSRIPSELINALGNVKPVKVMAAFDYIIVLDNEDEVKKLSPNLSKWLNIDLRGVVVTAPGHDVDFVSRCFFPKLNVNEDPVTGSAHCELTPYWASILNKNKLTARQISTRSGLVNCELFNDRVILSGSVTDYMVGEITL